MDIITNQVSFLDKEDDFFSVQDSVKALGVKIEAARSGRVNGNLCFYTPKAMKQGTETFLKPFAKHIQSKHNGEALGPITEAEYVPELFPNASKEFLDIVKRVVKYSEESNGKELVKAAKELIKTPEYRDESYRGLGIANIYADIHDPQAIYDIKTRKRNKGTVSIGGKSSEIYCSVCGDRATREHEHKKGQVYDDEVCFHVHNDLLLDHCGFVTVPADKLTNTEIVKDEDLNINITHFKTEKCMQLEQLKEAIKDASAVKTLLNERVTALGFDEAAQTAAYEAYEASLKNSRGNHFLFSADKLLNLRTVVGIAVAEDLISKMADEDDNKALLASTVEKAKAVIGVENTEEALKEFLTPKVEEPVVEPEQPVQDSLTTTNDLLVQISELIDAKIQAFLDKFSGKVQDQQDESLTKELLSLRDTLDSDEVTIKNLNDNYKTALIELIKVKKGGSVSEAYLEKLQGRSVEELKLTLEDLDEQTEEKVSEKEPEKQLEPATQEDAIAKVADEQQEVPATEEKPEETEDVKVEDSLEQTPEQWLQARVKEVGLATASREFKKKFK